ncbi:MAG: MEDS domain-containing protein [Myxococcales bacterium]
MASNHAQPLYGQSLDVGGAAHDVSASPASQAHPGHTPTQQNRPARARSTTGTFDHRVQFYEDDALLYDAVVAFFTEGLADGESLVAITTGPHREGLVTRLQQAQVDVEALCVSRRLVLLDAQQTLNGFMVDGRPDRVLFQHVVGTLIDELQASSVNGQVRAYGEMVDILWRAGAAEATLALERLWNELGEGNCFSLLCGYFIGAADGQGGQSPLPPIEQVCDLHRAVPPAGALMSGGDGAKALDQLALLQQRTLILEREVEHRKRLEQVLQAALSQRRRVEDELRASQQQSKVLEQELRRQNEDLSRTVRFSEMFVGILGHDLRNPLSAIATAASLLRRRADSDNVAKPAGRILNSAARMGRMIDQLLDFTRIRLGEGIPIDQQQTDLGEICRMAIDEVASVAPLPAVELKVTGDVVGWWDADRLLQLISNLLSNAVVHGRVPGAVSMRIGGTDDQRVVLDIHNAGVVPDAMLPLLFEPFRSGSNNKTEGSHGLGLGLFISQQIARAHAGNIDVTSSDVDGTRFTLIMPRVPRGPKPVFGLTKERF